MPQKSDQVSPSRILATKKHKKLKINSTWFEGFVVLCGIKEFWASFKLQQFSRDNITGTRDSAQTAFVAIESSEMERTAL